MKPATNQQKIEIVKLFLMAGKDTAIEYAKQLGVQCSTAQTIHQWKRKFENEGLSLDAAVPKNFKGSINIVKIKEEGSIRSSRTSYPKAFKDKVTEYATKVGIREASALYTVPYRTVFNWVNGR